MAIDLSKYFEADEIPIIKSLYELRGAKELLGCVKKLREKYDKALHDKPKESPEDWTKDWRCHLGMVRFADEILSLPEAAGELLNPKEDGKK